MERHANYGLIGGLTIGLLVAAFAFVFWLGQAQFASSFDEYRIVFTGPVRGLSEGSEVQFKIPPRLHLGEFELLQSYPDDEAQGVELLAEWLKGAARRRNLKRVHSRAYAFNSRELPRSNRRLTIIPLSRPAALAAVLVAGAQSAFRSFL